MRDSRWLRLIVGVVSVVGGVVGGFVLALVGWSLAIDQDPASEAGGVGLIWIFCLVTVPLTMLAIHSVLVRLLGLRR